MVLQTLKSESLFPIPALIKKQILPLINENRMRDTIHRIRKKYFQWDIRELRLRLQKGEDNLDHDRAI